MDDIIHLLPDSVANQIAAGEVVQRPASIIKEMVENSVDAGATSIEVIVTDGGKNLVQVIDNGKGMSETDARMSFERHATSKILNAKDLFSLHTMGFRGEALASIAAVAQVDLRTRRATDELGTYIRIAGSKLEEQSPVACPAGSNFSVMNLFYNVPARRKFLKSSQTETQNIITEFTKTALVNPDIAFKLTSNGNLLYELPQASLRQRIADIFGRKINAELLPAQGDTSLVTISGFVGTPESAKKKGARQYFFVNGRYMRHPYFHSAVIHAYDNIIPQGEQPSYILYMSVDPQTIDVNVHPAKTEIKFDNEQAIWQVLTAVVKESLGRYSNVPSIDFDTEDKPSIPIMPTSSGSKTPQYNPFTRNTPARADSKEWTQLYKGVNTFDMPPPMHSTHSGSLVTRQEDCIVDGLMGIGSGRQNPQATLWQQQDNASPDFLYTLQPQALTDQPHLLYKGRYIVTCIPEGLLFVDQHRAHVRVLYEQFIRDIKERKGVMQRLLFPELTEFTPKEQITLTAIMPQLESIGFDLSSLGKGSWSINAMPADAAGLSPQKLLHDLVYVAMEQGSSIKEQAGQALALALAQSSAIAYGQLLTDEEASQLLSQLFSLPSPLRTPDGKTVFTIIRHASIETLFA